MDSSTSTQVVLLLKQLAQEGRTIVCTIHQPSALLFGLFDHLYAMAEGQCIYSGATQMLVPFLTELDLICPKTYNPSDYCECTVSHTYFAYINEMNDSKSFKFLVLEISTHDYGQHNDRLINKIQNGLSTDYRQQQANSTANYCVIAAGKHLKRNFNSFLRFFRN